MKKKIMAVLAAAALICAGGCSNNDTAVTVGKLQLTKTDFGYYLNSVKEEFKTKTKIRNDDEWQTVEIEGKKAIDAAKEQALEVAVNNMLFIEIGEIKAPLDEEQLKAVNDFRNKMVSQTGGEENYQLYLKKNGITDVFFQDLFESETYRRNLALYLKNEEPVDDSVLKEELLKSYRRAKHILIMTIDPDTHEALTEEEAADAKLLADDIYARVQAGEDFDTLMNTYSEDTGLETNPDGYVFTDNQMVKEFQDGVDGLEIGEMCMVKTDFGYHIIKRLAIDETDEVCSQAIEKNRNALEGIVYNEILKSKLDDWRKELGIEVNVNESYYKKVK